MPNPERITSVVGLRLAYQTRTPLWYGGRKTFPMGLSIEVGSGIERWRMTLLVEDGVKWEVSGNIGDDFPQPFPYPSRFEREAVLLRRSSVYRTKEHD